MTRIEKLVLCVTVCCLLLVYGNCLDVPAVDLDEIPDGCFGAAIGHEKVLGCANSTLSGLNFCKFMNGKTTDFAYSGSKVSATMTYAQFYDKALERAFKKLNDTFAAGMKSMKGEVCDVCYQRLKTLMCMNAFPASGYRSCLVNSMVKKFTKKTTGAEVCPGLCSRMDDKLCSIAKNGSYVPFKDPGLDLKQLSCIVRKLPGISTMFDSCKVYLTPAKRCLSAMASCGCVTKKDAKAICAKSFSDVGLRDDKGWPRGTCADHKKWCATKKKDKDATSLIVPPLVLGNLVCPNEKFCIGGITPIPFPSPTQVFPFPSEERIAGSLGCSIDGDNFEKCQTGCTDPKAYRFDPFARIHDRSCMRHKDGLIWVSYGRGNLGFLIFVVIVLILVLFCLWCSCVICVCLKCQRCCICGKVVAKEWKYEKYQYA